MSRRLNDMDAAGVDVQVLSNTPQTFLYHREGALAAALSAIQNDQSARAVAGNPGRLVDIATLPMQAPELAAAELRRAMGKLELKGAQIGSNIHGRNLDDAGLEPLWAAANELDADMGTLECARQVETCRSRKQTGKQSSVVRP